VFVVVVVATAALVTPVLAFDVVNTTGTPPRRMPVALRAVTETVCAVASAPEALVLIAEVALPEVNVGEAVTVSVPTTFDPCTVEGYDRCNSVS
jgi:hypothetical protein